ncbi:MAG: 2OG-Fe(II) oxygenase [Candidatus Eremiobacterota bacterium]
MRREWLHEGKVFVLHDFLSELDCRDQVALTEREGYTVAGLTVGPDRYVMNPEVRNNYRVIRDDPQFARQLWFRARPWVPEEIEEWRVRGLNERLRYYRYDPGQRFAPHYDGKFTRHPREHSKLTFMVYLNQDFEGGETIFYTDRNVEKLRVVPRTGMALVFLHQLLHEGACVRQGRKYVLRTDVMYAL